MYHTLFIRSKLIKEFEDIIWSVCSSIITEILFIHKIRLQVLLRDDSYYDITFVITVCNHVLPEALQTSEQDL